MNTKLVGVVAALIALPLCAALVPVKVVHTFDPLNLARAKPFAAAAAPATNIGAAAAAAAVALAPLPALAKGGEFGLCEGRIISLAHPVAMGGCFLATLNAGYTGFQWRRLREIGAELGGAKKVAKAATAATPFGSSRPWRWGAGGR